MAYRLKHGESVPKGVKRIAREEIESAVEYLRGRSGVDPDKAVHEVRKSIKKMRALLRLVAAGLDGAYDQENARLRDIGRQLSELRDADAVIGAFDGLKGRCQSSLGNGEMASLRRPLVLHKKRLRDELSTRPFLNEVARALAQTLHSAREWPLQGDGFPAIEPGLKKTFRDGRKAFEIAQRTGRREDFHEWRKRVKDHWYHVRLLEKVWTDVMQGYEHSLKDLEDALGEDLNLAILREQILSPRYAQVDRHTTNMVVRAIDSCRQDLRDRAVKIGERVYTEKPRRFTREMKRLWDAWHAKADWKA